MEIHLNQGVDDILFGMTETDIIDRLGIPNKIVSTDLGNRDLIYNELKLVFKLELENAGLLGWIEVHNKISRWLNVNPWTLEREALLEFLSQHLEEDYQFDDYGHMESYTFTENWVELQYEFECLTSFNFGSCK
jgi:hypothetical protein